MNRYPQKTNSSLLIYIISIFFIFLVSTTEAYAATYYISSTDGDDTCTGLSQSPYTTGVTACPIKTLTKLNTKTFSPGDSILFKKGDTFYGSITVSQSGTAGNPITFSSYGSGEKPIITGFTDVTSWTNLGNNIWESTNAVSTLSYLNVVSVNNENATMGRTPNEGSVYTVDSHNANSSITSSNLTGTPNWTGAQVVIRKELWIWQVANINSQSGGTINYTDVYSGGGFSPRDTGGFFIQADSKTLDVQNEWYYNPSTKKLQIYSTSQPINVKVPNINYIVNLYSKSNLNFEDITFQGSNEIGMLFNASSNILIQDCNFIEIGFEAVSYYNTQNMEINNNTFTNINSGAIIGSASSLNDKIINNTIDNTYTKIGIGRLYAAAAIGVYASNSYVRYNRVSNTGYHGIFVNSNEGQIRNNFVSNVLLNTSDGGGIYSYGPRTNLIIDGNICMNALGNSLGAVNQYDVATGIYLDNTSANVTISNNTVTQTTRGISVSGANHITITNNLVYDVEVGGMKVYNFFNTAGSTNNITLTNNQFVQKSSLESASVAAFQSVYSNDIELFFLNNNNNIYARPLNDNATFTVYQPGLIGNYKSLSDWQTFSSQDTNSKKSPISITSESDIFFDYNATTSNKTVSLPWPVVDMDGNKVTGNVTILPYRSVIYLKDPSPNTVDSLPPSISSFTIPTTSTSLAISITTLSATDSTGVTGYLLSESSTTPSASSGSWSSTPQTSYTFTTQGTKTLYAFAKDLAGNVSLSSSDTITITLPVVTPPAGGGGGGGGASSTTTITCPTGTTLVNTTCVTNTTTSATLIDKAKQKDIKPDGSINIIDFNIIMANWNKTYTKDISLTKGDITGDGLINIFDMNQLMVMWGVRY